MKKNYFSRKGLVLVLSSPSGVGKTTISRKLVSEDKNLSLSISVTTRDEVRLKEGIIILLIERPFPP